MQLRKMKTAKTAVPGRRRPLKGSKTVVPHSHLQRHGRQSTRTTSLSSAAATRRHRPPPKPKGHRPVPCRRAPRLDCADDPAYEPPARELALVRDVPEHRPQTRSQNLRLETPPGPMTRSKGRKLGYVDVGGILLAPGTVLVSPYINAEAEPSAASASAASYLTSPVGSSGGGYNCISEEAVSEAAMADAPAISAGHSSAGSPLMGMSSHRLRTPPSWMHPCTGISCHDLARNPELMALTIMQLAQRDNERQREMNALRRCVEEVVAATPSAAVERLTEAVQQLGEERGIKTEEREARLDAIEEAVEDLRHCFEEDRHHGALQHLGEVVQAGQDDLADLKDRMRM